MIIDHNKCQCTTCARAHEDQATTAAKRPKSILDHSQQRVGKQWRDVDHFYLKEILLCLAAELVAKARKGTA